LPVQVSPNPIKSSMNPTILNISSIVINDNNREKVEKISSDLQLIKQQVPAIDKIVVRGGCAIDVIMGLEPNDVDLFYSYFEDGVHSSKCRCEEIKQQINDLPFKYFSEKDIDLENSYEKEPMLDPIERTVSIFSFHTDFNSMFVIDEDGQIWSNRESLNAYLTNTFEVRYEGCLPWPYFPHEGDSQEYFSFLTYVMIRGIGYILKRNLKVGDKFHDLIKQSPFIISKGLNAHPKEKFREYAGKKIGEFTNAEKFFTMNGYNQEIFDTFKMLLVD
jgi:hypothetical protein